MNDINMKHHSNISIILPVLFGFFIMGFCDVVGIATSYVQQDFHLNETMAGFIPSAVFLWFLLLSIPSALIMNKIGRKRMVIASDFVTVAGMLIPFFSYNLATCLTAFLLLGVGNTMLQVSLNPLLTNVVKGKALTSSLTAGQVVKALSSFCGPFIAAFAINVFGEWQLMFPIFALITMISMLWLQFTHIEEEPMEKGSSFGKTLALLGNPSIFFLFLGIFFIVGADVGINTVGPKLLIERCQFPVCQAGYASSLYFVFRTVGTFVGTMLLAKISEVKYFRVNIVLALAAIAVLFFMQSVTGILVAIGCIGFFCSSVFSIIYSVAFKQHPDKENEISGLMIMGIFGGAVIPPVMGLMADAIGNQIGSLLVITTCIFYLTVCAFSLKASR